MPPKIIVGLGPLELISSEREKCLELYIPYKRPRVTVPVVFQKEIMHIQLTNEVLYLLIMFSKELDKIRGGFDFHRLTSVSSFDF